MAHELGGPIVAVDLAAKLSAVCILSPEGEVMDEFSSFQISTGEFILQLVHRSLASLDDLGEEAAISVIAIEGIPHGMKFIGMVSKTLRLQGRILQALDRFSLMEKVLFVPPALWQRTFPGVWRQGPEAVIPAAKELLGYDPPDTGWESLHHQARQDGKKAMTDYCAARLIAEWCKNVYEETGTFDAKSTSRYLP